MCISVQACAQMRKCLSVYATCVRCRKLIDVYSGPNGHRHRAMQVVQHHGCACACGCGCTHACVHACMWRATLMSKFEAVDFDLDGCRHDGRLVAEKPELVPDKRHIRISWCQHSFMPTLLDANTARRPHSLVPTLFGVNTPWW